jgi:hypothetical protein
MLLGSIIILVALIFLSTHAFKDVDRSNESKEINVGKATVRVMWKNGLHNDVIVEGKVLGSMEFVYKAEDRANDWIREGYKNNAFCIEGKWINIDAIRDVEVVQVENHYVICS